MQIQSWLEIEDPSGPSGPLLFGNGSPQPICRLAAIELKSQDSWLCQIANAKYQLCTPYTYICLIRRAARTWIVHMVESVYAKMSCGTVSKYKSIIQMVKKVGQLWLFFWICLPWTDLRFSKNIHPDFGPKILHTKSSYIFSKRNNVNAFISVLLVAFC